MKIAQGIWDEILAATSLDEMNELMIDLVALAAEEFWLIGTYKPIGGYNVVKTNFRNVPDNGWGSWRYPNPGPYNPQQFFWDL
jgi:peptide/nickel transport system substrate-binding protein